MAKSGDKDFNLFDVLDAEDAKEKPEDCTHRLETRSVTVWPGETKIRLTMTCEICGRIRGRYPGE